MATVSVEARRKAITNISVVLRLLEVKPTTEEVAEEMGWPVEAVEAVAHLYCAGRDQAGW